MVDLTVTIGVLRKPEGMPVAAAGTVCAVARKSLRHTILAVEQPGAAERGPPCAFGDDRRLDKGRQPATEKVQSHGVGNTGS